MSAVFLLVALAQVPNAGDVDAGVPTVIIVPPGGFPPPAAPDAGYQQLPPAIPVQVPAPIPPPMTPPPPDAGVPPSPTGFPVSPVLPPPPPLLAPDAGSPGQPPSGPPQLVVGAGLESGLTLFPSGNPLDTLFFGRPLIRFVAGDDFGLELGATFNLRVIDDVPFNRANDIGGVLRREDWDEASDFGQILRLVSVGKLDSQVWARAGAVRLRTLGNGHLISRYSNQDNPDYHPASGAVGLLVGPVRAEFFASDLFGARIFSGLAGLELGRLVSKDPNWFDRFWLTFEIAHDAGRAGGVTPAATLLHLDFTALLYRSGNARVQALVGLGTRAGDRADFGALAGLSAEADLDGFLLAGKLEARKQAGGFRQGYIGPQYELTRFSSAGFDGVPLADSLLPDSFSFYGELRVGSPKFVVAELALEHYVWGRTDLDTSLQAELVGGRFVTAARFTATALGVKPRYAAMGEARFRLFKSFYLMGAGGIMMVPQADGTLHRGPFVTAGVGVDFETGLTP